MSAMGQEGRAIALRCAGVTKSYASAGGAVPVLRGIDLEAREGEILFLVGPSGCGKTTLITIIAGLLQRDAGDCVVLGHDQETMGKSEAATFRRDNIGFVFQAYNLIPTLTIAENVMIPLLLRGRRRSEAHQAAVAALGSVGLAAKADERPARLSGGQQQRVAIARAIVHAPRLIVCDEPTSALDHTNGQDIMRLLRGLAHEQGATLIVVTHDHRIYDYADRIAEMDDGRVVRITAPKAAAERQHA
ncbi:ABC transporter ATP-binding protein [Roseomonas sp. GC11]|uniref:ABC transporter ATP-binding protein n=1 Tax=Roseomonas sp. GC11 TaxID=2950546 RepID=UPI00210D046E|nr:ABC transporter ATP-binding protein [Roseomonas sp. GC11]MCQ4160999.1 ABC transporter ATP-binding protein [Roseomonas sp. GC11]